MVTATTAISIALAIPYKARYLPIPTILSNEVEVDIWMVHHADDNIRGILLPSEEEEGEPLVKRVLPPPTTLVIAPTVLLVHVIFAVPAKKISDTTRD